MKAQHRMRDGIVVLLIVIFLSVSPKAEENGKYLFILSGQSNMSEFDPDITFTPAVHAALGKENVIVVKDALDGQPIRRWYKRWKISGKGDSTSNGDLYDRLMKRVNAAINGYKLAAITFIWMQGEMDAQESHGDVYAASLKGLMDQLCEDFGREDINFVIGRLSDFDMANERLPHWTMVRDAQVEVADADPRVVWVNTDDLNDGINSNGEIIRNDLHYSVEGYRKLGERFARESIGLIRE